MSILEQHCIEQVLKWYCTQFSLCLWIFKIGSESISRENQSVIRGRYQECVSLHIFWQRKSINWKYLITSDCKSGNIRLLKLDPDVPFCPTCTYVVPNCNYFKRNLVSLFWINYSITKIIFRNRKLIVSMTPIKQFTCNLYDVIWHDMIWWYDMIWWCYPLRLSFIIYFQLLNIVPMFLLPFSFAK